MSRLVIPPVDFTSENVKQFVDLIRTRFYFLARQRAAYERAREQGKMVANAPLTNSPKTPNSLKLQK